MKPINGIEYQQPDFQKFKAEFLNLTTDLNNATHFEQVKSTINSINTKRNLWESMSCIAEINHFSDLTNKDFEEAVNFYENHSSDLKLLVNNYYSAIIDSEYKNQIAEVYGKQLIEIAQNETKLFDGSLKELQAEESKLKRAFGNHFYQMQYQIDDKSYSADSIKPLLTSPNRNDRKKAVLAQNTKLEELENSIAEIIVKITKVRNKIAKASGFETYVQYGFKKLGRYDYGITDIENHRNSIIQNLVPFTSEIRKRQAKRIGVKDLKFHDYEYLTPDKNLTFEYDSSNTIEQIAKMFGELSKETGDLFKKMKANGLIESTIEKNRMPGNFAFYIPEKKTPFLHTNFSGAKDDFNLLCHEFGHAFGYTQSDTEIPEYVYPFVEGAETQSTAMEYFCWQWIENFFGKNAAQYKVWHLSFALLYQPQLSLIDEFEQYLYENEPQNAEELKAHWKKTELKYLPFIKYEDTPFFASGGRYMAFANWYIDYPFWSICYSLAQINALQLWKEFNIDREKGWNKYLEFCKQGGRASVLDSLKKCGIQSPLESKNIESTIKMACDELRNLYALT